MMRSVALLGLPALVAGHAAMVIPRPRNAIEGTVFPWNGAVPEFEPVSGSNESLSTWCPISSGKGKGSDNNALSGINGQSCFCAPPACSHQLCAPPPGSPAPLEHSRSPAGKCAGRV